MGRMPCCEKVGLKKGPWTSEEDHKLVSYVERHGHGSWRTLPSKAGLQRCGKSCRLRWTNYLRPDIKRGKFNVQEEQTIIQLHALLGNRWSAIATHLPKRTDNEIKNYWNTQIKKRLTKMGIDPITHRRRISTIGIGNAKSAANLSHMAQWENARLEAEARLVREAKLVSSGPNQPPQYKSVAHPSLSRAIRPQPLCLDVLKAWQGIMLSTSSNNGITFDSPTSSRNYFENTPTMNPYVGFFDNRCMSMVNYVALGMPNQGAVMAENINNDSKILESDIVTVANKEKIVENSNELDQMVYPNNAFMEDFTQLIDVASTHNLNEKNNNDLEENWNNILNNWVNSSPLGSPVF